MGSTNSVQRRPSTPHQQVVHIRPTNAQLPLRPVPSPASRPPFQQVSMAPRPHFNPMPPSGARFPPPPPPPRLDIQQTCVVKNPVNLRKKTLSITKDPASAHIYYISFCFDASAPAELRVYLGCREVTDPQTSIPTLQCPPGKATSPVYVDKGMNQFYKSSQGEALNLLEHQLSDLQYRDGASIYPVVICLRAISGEDAVQSQYTYATLVRGSGTTPRDQVEPSTDTHEASASGNAPTGSGTDDEDTNIGRSWSIKTLKQKIQFGHKSFEVQEIYGIDRSNTGSGFKEEEDLLSGRECVICLAEERNTAVLPCRHMCLCSACANIMRTQSNKCPICRQTVNSLLQISVDVSSVVRRESEH